jgi:antibiotic biosynthesis monooxygenase (ABM) superfamily enzyme
VIPIIAIMPQPSAITVAITRTVQPAHHRRFNAWVQAGQELARERPGYLGSGWVRTAPDSNEWHVLYRFADAKSLRAWDESDDRKWWIDSGAELIEDTKVEHRTGIEGWFEPQGETALTIPETVVPPRWKQAVSIFRPFFPLSLLSTYLLLPHLSAWPPVLAVLLNICLLTPLMTYIFLPVSTRLLRPWLQKPRRPKRQR